MKQIVMFLSLILSASACMSATPNQVEAFLASAGVQKPDQVFRAKVLISDVGDGLGPRIVRWRVQGIPQPAEGELPSEAEAEVILVAAQEVNEQARQAAKSDRLKGFEKQLIQFLRNELAIPADAVSATPEQIDAMYANWEATLNDTQLEKKSTKYTRLLEKVERAGGTEADAHYHAD